MRELKSNESNIMWALKGIAILSVICAHVGTVTWNNIIVVYSSHILSNFGSIGVGIFYFVSGYYYNPDKKDLIKEKIIKICIPWIIASTCIWLYIVLRKGDITALSWIKVVIGDGSIFYFLTNLMVYFIFVYLISYIKNKNIYNGLLICIIVISQYFIILESQGISFFSSSYLNPFVFVAYFILGHLIGMKKISMYISDNKILRRYIGGFSLILLISPMFFTYYYNGLSILMEVVFIYGMMNICLEISSKYQNFFIELGKKSFAIYLWHIPIAGIVTNLMNRTNFLQMLTLLRPIIVLFVVLGGIRLIEELFSKRQYLKLMLSFTGITIRTDKTQEKSVIRKLTKG